MKPCLRIARVLVVTGICAMLTANSGLLHAQASIETLTAAAKKGSASAQYELALRYLKGDGTQSNDKEAFNLLQKAAKSDANAQHLLGFCYAAGYGTKANFKEAVNWYRK